MEGPLEDFVVRFGAPTAYRDDSYIAAWQGYGVEGHIWETFDQLIQNSPLTFDDLLLKVERRIPTQELLDGNLKEVIARRWIEEDVGSYQITIEGKRVREEAEALTDQYFFAPWSCLAESELDELARLANQLRDGLKKQSES